MRVELSPARVEVTVGESVVLSCRATHDTSLDVVFQWFFNQKPINFQQDGGHFESIQTVRARVRAKIKTVILVVVLSVHLFYMYLLGIIKCFMESHTWPVYQRLVYCLELHL